MNNTARGHLASAGGSKKPSLKVGSIGVARIAGALFITATGATMISQIMMEPLRADAGLTDMADRHRGTLAAAALFEIINALASAGIAITLYPVLRRCAELPATGYLGMRLIEAAVGVFAVIGLIILLETTSPLTQLAFVMHDWMFLLVLIVFSIGTFLLYPMLFQFRIVPKMLSVWGLIGGAMLLASCVSILFGWIEMGGTTDLLLSLPIWINEMALAIWLIFKGFNLSYLPDGSA
ncbi:MAG: DUF4386 domain-containing protein [Pseudomonadota bacterium]